MKALLAVLIVGSGLLVAPRAHTASPPCEVHPQTMSVLAETGAPGGTRTPTLRFEA